MVQLYTEDEKEESEQCGCEFRCCGISRTKRFHLQSQELGLVASCYDIGSLCCLLFVTYVGGRSHKTLWLGWGTFIMGCGAILFSLPHFFAPRYNPQTTNEDLCLNALSPECGDIGLRAYRAFFFVGQVLHGIGASPFYTLGITYIDENVEQMYSSTYHAIYYTFSILGPGIGYILGGSLLTLYTNLDEITDLPETSQLWVGAWWLGFLCAGVFTVIISFPIQMFPHQFPNTEHVRQHREREMQKDELAEDTRHDPKFGSKLKDFPKSFLIIIRNPTLVFISIAGAMESGLIAGVSTFGPKFTASIFSISSSSASLAYGGLAIGGGICGMLVGGISITKFKFSLPQMLKFCVVTAFISFGGLFIFLITCPNADFAGGTVAYHTETTMTNVTSTCNGGCGCERDFYNPVCGSDGVSYYSPCYAGCTQYMGNESSPFFNCECIGNSPNVSLSSATAKYGICQLGDCPNYGIFIGFMFISVTFTFINSIPALQATIRSVPFNQRSFGVGIQWIILRVLGAIPGPLIFGRVLDLTCLVWNEECGHQGSCKIYDNNKMSRYLLALALSYKHNKLFSNLCQSIVDDVPSWHASFNPGMAILMFLLALALYKPNKKEGSDSTSVPNGASQSQSQDLDLHALPEKKNSMVNPGFEGDEDRTPF